jgi:hypothetical protein
MTLTYKIINRQKTMLVFENDNPNFVSSAQFNIIGDKGFAHTIIGDRFYEIVRTEINAMFKDLEVRTIEAYVRRSHFRLLKMALKNHAVIEELGSGDMAGMNMVWVKISLLESVEV